LGAYCLGLSEQYSAAVPASLTSLRVLPSLAIQVPQGRLSPEEVLALETWAEPVGEGTWRLDRARGLDAMARGHDPAGLVDFLQQRDDQPLPETVQGWVSQLRRMGQALSVQGTALLLECLDAEIAERIAAHPDTAPLCARLGDKQLVVRSTHEAKFRARARALGFGLTG
jgi:hypothetical protein